MTSSALGAFVAPGFVARRFLAPVAGASAATRVGEATWPSAALRASAALRWAAVYSRQWGLHIRPRPSFWLG